MQWAGGVAAPAVAAGDDDVLRLLLLVVGVDVEAQEAR
jgi:hypothetical protein